MPTYTFKDNNTGLEFDEFMDSNHLWDLAVSSYNNSLIKNKFLKGKLSKNLEKKLNLQKEC